MMKRAIVSALLFLGLAAMSIPASGAEAVMPSPDCYDCSVPKNYDSQEVVKTSHDVDHSRVINTTSYAPAYQRRGDAGSIRVRSDVTLVNFVVHRYRVIEAPALVPEGAVERPRRSCGHGGHHNRYDCGPLRVRD
jgi:hypothetical protein